MENEEQLEKMKAFWAKFGNLITIVLVVAAIVVAGFRVYQDHKRKTALQASELFTEILTTSQKLNQARNAKALAGVVLEEGDTDEKDSKIEEYDQTLRFLSKRMDAEHSGSVYNDYVKLLLARFDVESGNLEQSQSLLEGLSQSSKHPYVQGLAKVRLAKVLVQQGALDQALALTQAPMDEGFQGELFDIQGDIYVKQLAYDKAAASYEKALAVMEKDVPLRQITEWKLKDIKVKAEYIENIGSLPEPEPVDEADTVEPESALGADQGVDHTSTDGGAVEVEEEKVKEVEGVEIEDVEEGIAPAQSE